MSIGGGDGPFCVRARRSPTLPAPKKSSIAFAVEGRVTRTDIPGLCAALALVLEESGGEVVDAGFRDPSGNQIRMAQLK